VVPLALQKVAQLCSGGITTARSGTSPSPIASRTLVTGERLSTIYLWDIAAGKVTATFASPSDYGVSCVAFAPGGTTVAVGQDTGAILLWNTRTGKVTAGPSGPRSDSGLWVGAIAFGPGGTLAAGGYSNGDTTYLWDATGTLIAAVTDPARRIGGRGQVLALWFSPGGTTLTIGDGNGATYLWRITR
jgi:WD40 repeat protein